MTWKLYLDNNKCDGCEELHKKFAESLSNTSTNEGECVLVCPVEVFEMKGGKSIVTGEMWCIGCASCLEVCPTNAIELDYINE